MSVPSPTPAFSKLLIALGSGPQERTLEQLFHDLGLGQEEYFLTRLADADRILRDCGVDVQPRLQDGPPDGVFLLRVANVGGTSEADVKARLNEGETASQEFKSTYWCDLQRRIHQPNATSKQLRSDDVRHSALKALAGLLTTGGGRLFIGVDDAGGVLGLGPDLEILQHNRRKYRSTDQQHQNRHSTAIPRRKHRQRLHPHRTRPSRRRADTAAGSDFPADTIVSRFRQREPSAVPKAGQQDSSCGDLRA